MRRVFTVTRTASRNFSATPFEVEGNSLDKRSRRDERCSLNVLFGEEGGGQKAGSFDNVST